MKNRPLSLMIIISALLALGLQVNGQTPDTISIADINFKFSKAANNLKTKFTNTNDSLWIFSERIRLAKNKINDGAASQDTEYAKSLLANTKLLEKSITQNDQNALRTLKDVYLDLQVKTASSGYNLASAFFDPITFEVEVFRKINNVITLVPNCLIRATAWGDRDLKIATYAFNDQATAPKLRISLVRGAYCFWVESLDGVVYPKRANPILVTTNPAMASPIKLFIQ